MSHQAQVPSTAARYFGFSRNQSTHPIVVQEFHPQRGWKRTGFNKRISGAWARKLKSQGITEVALSDGVRTADFRIGELTR